MKSLPLTTPAFMLLLEQYRQYLETLGYAGSSVYCLPNHVQEFLFFLEERNKNRIQQIDAEIIKDYLHYLQHRNNERQGGGLSTGSILKQTQAVHLLTDYLRRQYHLSIARQQLDISREKNMPDVLTQSEIRLLYQAAALAAKRGRNTPDWLPEALLLRDKAMLGIFYGCGLRRNEGVQLDTTDLHRDTRMLHVRKGKNYKERFVPVPKQVYYDLEAYLYESRPLFLKVISTYRKSSIRSEIPGQFLKQTVEEALKSGNTTIRKLLTDGRFIK